MPVNTEQTQVDPKILRESKRSFGGKQIAYFKLFNEDGQRTAAYTPELIANQVAAAYETPALAARTDSLKIAKPLPETLEDYVAQLTDLGIPPVCMFDNRIKGSGYVISILQPVEYNRRQVVFFAAFQQGKAKAIQINASSQISLEHLKQGIERKMRTVIFVYMADGVKVPYSLWDLETGDMGIAFKLCGQSNTPLALIISKQSRFAKVAEFVTSVMAHNSSIFYSGFDNIPQAASFLIKRKP